MNQAAVFLAGSILTMMGFIVIIIGSVIINNILHRYWKPIKIWRFETYPPQYIHTDDLPKEEGNLKK